MFCLYSKSKNFFLIIIFHFFSWKKGFLIWFGKLSSPIILFDLKKLIWNRKFHLKKHTEFINKQLNLFLKVRISESILQISVSVSKCHNSNHGFLLLSDFFLLNFFFTFPSTFIIEFFVCFVYCLVIRMSMTF